VPLYRLGGVLAVALLLLATPVRAACPTAFEQEVVLLVNQERATRGISPLALDDRLLAAAQGHALDMATNNFMSHTGSDGSSARDRIVAAGYTGPSWGENVAAGFFSPASVVSAWMGSSGHRANILNPSFEHIGVGWAYGPGTTYGNYQAQSFGGGTTLVAACGSSPPGGVGDPDALALCQSTQLKALSRLSRDQLSCAAKFISRPDRDPGGAKWAACLQKAEDRFTRLYDKARSKAAGDLAVCALDDSASAVVADAESEADAAYQGVAAGFDPSGFDPKDRVQREDARLRAALLRESGRLFQKGLAAESRHATKPDAEKRDAKRQKARDSFDNRSGKALARALDRGVGYAGTDAASLGDQCESLVDDWVSTTTP
jgi:hypothetical protein